MAPWRPLVPCAPLRSLGMFKSLGFVWKHLMCDIVSIESLLNFPACFESLSGVLFFSAFEHVWNSCLLWKHFEFPLCFERLSWLIVFHYLLKDFEHRVSIVCYVFELQCWPNNCHTFCCSCVLERFRILKFAIWSRRGFWCFIVRLSILLFKYTLLFRFCVLLLILIIFKTEFSNTAMRVYIFWFQEFKFQFRELCFVFNVLTKRFANKVVFRWWRADKVNLPKTLFLPRSETFNAIFLAPRLGGLSGIRGGALKAILPAVGSR